MYKYYLLINILRIQLSRKIHICMHIVCIYTYINVFGKEIFAYHYLFVEIIYIT